MSRISKSYMAELDKQARRRAKASDDRDALLKACRLALRFLLTGSGVPGEVDAWDSTYGKVVKIPVTIRPATDAALIKILQDTIAEAERDA